MGLIILMFALPSVSASIYSDIRYLSVSPDPVAAGGTLTVSYQVLGTGGSYPYETQTLYIEGVQKACYHDNIADNSWSSKTRYITAPTSSMQHNVKVMVYGCESSTGCCGSWDDYEIKSFTVSGGTTTTCNSRSTSTDTSTIYPTTNWQTVSGSLSSGTDTKRYKVTVSTSGQHEFSLCSSDGGSCNYDSYLCLFDSNGNPATSNDDYCGLASKITYNLAIGTYYVQVSGYSSNYGTYTLSYRRTPSGTTTTCNSRSTSTDTSTIYPTTNWQTVSGSLSSGTDTKRYKVTVSTSGQHEFSLCSSDGGSCNYDSYLCLFDSNGNPATSNDDYCGLASKITYNLAIGTYYVQVSGYSSNYGTYTLAYKKTCPNAFFDDFNFLNTTRWKEDNNIDCSNPDTTKTYCKIESPGVKFTVPQGYAGLGVEIISPPLDELIYYYGNYEARFKAATGNADEHLISAFWTSNRNTDNPYSEIDFEFLGEEIDTVHMAIHKSADENAKDTIFRVFNMRTGTQETCIYNPLLNCTKYVNCEQHCKPYQIPQNIPCDQAFRIDNYHNYKFEWRSNYVDFFVDNIRVWNMNDNQYVPASSVRYKYIFNLWQHNWRGNAPQPVDYDRSMVVDWAKYEC